MKKSIFLKVVNNINRVGKRDQYGRKTPWTQFFDNAKTGIPSYNLFWASSSLCGGRSPHRSPHSLERANVKG